MRSEAGSGFAGMQFSKLKFSNVVLSVLAQLNGYIQIQRHHTVFIFEFGYRSVQRALIFCMAKKTKQTRLGATVLVIQKVRLAAA